MLTFCFLFSCRLVPSLPPQDIKIQNSSSTSISVQWKPIPKYHVNGILLGIKLFYRSAPRDNSIVFSSRARRSTEEDWSEYTIITLQPGALSYEMTSLKKFTNYSVSILGFTSKGDGNVSQQFVVSTDEDGQYDRVDILHMFVISVDCEREVYFCLFCSQIPRGVERNQTSRGERRSIDRFRLSPLFFFCAFFLAVFRAKERLLADNHRNGEVRTWLVGSLLGNNVIRFGFCQIRNNQGIWHRMITLTSTLIILDITKPSSIIVYNYKAR